MSLATIKPLPGGTALLIHAGVEQPFGSYQAASDEAQARGLRVFVERFPPTPLPLIAVVAMSGS